MLSGHRVLRPIACRQARCNWKHKAGKDTYAKITKGHDHSVRIRFNNLQNFLTLRSRKQKKMAVSPKSKTKSIQLEQEIEKFFVRYSSYLTNNQMVNEDFFLSNVAFDSRIPEVELLIVACRMRDWRFIHQCCCKWV